jgi:Nitroreductase family
MTDRLQMCLVDDADFPAAGSEADLLRFVLRYAVLAPSSHNSQPWLFYIDGNAVEIYADRARRMPVVDPEDRELVMSCGAALYNLRLALRHFGEGSDVAVLPEGTSSGLLATVRLTGTATTPDPQLEEQFAAIPNRHTCRRAFDQAPIDAEVPQRLHQAAFAEGARLVDVPEERRNSVTSLVTEADFVQMSHPDFRRELAHWMRPSHPARDDGMPGYALGLSELQSVAGPLIIRTFDIGMSQAAKDDELSRGSALLALIVTETDDVTDWIAAGQALQRVLLTATATGLQASFLNQPIEVSSMRLQLARALALEGNPQLLLRFGYGPSAAPTPRRPLSDVLLAARPTHPEHRSRTPSAEPIRRQT